MTDKRTVPTLDELAEQATATILRDGHHAHMILGFQEKKGFIVGIDSMHPNKSIRYAVAHEIGRRMKRQHKQQGALTDVFFIAEAWMVHTTEERINKEPLPSVHPDRIEVLILIHYNVSAEQYDIRVYEMIRSGKSLDLQLMESDTDYSAISSDLVKNFVAGWNK